MAYGNQSLASHVRCTKSLVPNADKRPKFPSNQTVKDPFTAGTATQSENRRDIKFINH
jgi:hypothetical protein